jgi:hypothetical protein
MTSPPSRVLARVPALLVGAAVLASACSVSACSSKKRRRPEDDDRSTRARRTAAPPEIDATPFAAQLDGKPADFSHAFVTSTGGKGLRLVIVRRVGPPGRPGVRRLSAL